jgi:4-hydroxybenzoate polyprenyltransferase
MKFNRPTFYLLNSASIVGFTGGLRLYVAFLIAGLLPKLSLVIAASLIIYATYTLDRSLGNKEDAINRKELSGADHTAGIFASMVALVGGVCIFFSEQLFTPPLLPFLIGIFYSCDFNFRGHSIKLKGGAGIKNFIIGLTWGGTIGLIIASTGCMVAGFIVGVYFAGKLFINSTIFDLKDVKGDIAAGIKTLPVCMSEKKLKYLLFIFYCFVHMILIIAIIMGILVTAWLFVVCSMAMSGLVILLYSPSFEISTNWMVRKFRVITINGEPVIQSLINTVPLCQLTMIVL